MFYIPIYITPDRCQKNPTITLAPTLNFSSNPISGSSSDGVSNTQTGTTQKRMSEEEAPGPSKKARKYALSPDDSSSSSSIDSSSDSDCNSDDDTTQVTIVYNDCYFLKYDLLNSGIIYGCIVVNHSSFHNFGICRSYLTKGGTQTTHSQSNLQGAGIAQGMCLDQTGEEKENIPGPNIYNHSTIFQATLSNHGVINSSGRAATQKIQVGNQITYIYTHCIVVSGTIYNHGIIRGLLVYTPQVKNDRVPSSTRNNCLVTELEQNRGVLSGIFGERIDTKQSDSMKAYSATCTYA